MNLVSCVFVFSRKPNVCPMNSTRAIGIALVIVVAVIVVVVKIVSG